MPASSPSIGMSVNQSDNSNECRGKIYAHRSSRIEMSIYLCRSWSNFKVVHGVFMRRETLEGDDVSDSKSFT